MSTNANSMIAADMETEMYDWVDRKLQAMVDAENENYMECYDWVDRKLQAIADAENNSYLECYDWVDRRLQEMADAEFNDLCKDAEDLHHFTYEEIHEYHEHRRMVRKMTSLHI